MQVRRASESCAFAAHIIKHHELGATWVKAGTSETDYKTYREAFKSFKVFQKEKTHPDHDPLLLELKKNFDLCSKLLHGSGGLANH